MDIKGSLFNKLKEKIKDKPQPAGEDSSLGFMSEGKSKGQEPPDLDPAELEMGIKVEMEHTTDPKVARKIALDHLTEFRSYYTALKAMEEALKELEGKE